MFYLVTKYCSITALMGVVSILINLQQHNSNNNNNNNIINKCVPQISAYGFRSVRLEEKNMGFVSVDLTVIGLMLLLYC